jgi:hypothetical protein
MSVNVISAAYIKYAEYPILVEEIAILHDISTAGIQKYKGRLQINQSRKVTWFSTSHRVVDVADFEQIGSTCNVENW